LTFDRVALDLRHHAFPELAAALRAAAERILGGWRSATSAAMPHLDRLTIAEFQNSIRAILGTVADALASADPLQLRALIDLAPMHGRDRFAQAVGLLDYFEEERILRGVAIVELDQAMGRPLAVGEAATFHAMFDLMVQQGAIALVQKQKDRMAAAEAALRESQRFLRASLDALTGNIAVLDGAGTILEVNESWRRFAAANAFVGDNYGVGSSYFQPCESAPSPAAAGNGAGDDDDDAGICGDGDGPAIAAGIRAVLAGLRDGFEAEYPCHSPSEQRWFLMRATRFQGPGPVRVVVVHDNVTERKVAEAERQRLVERLAEQSRVVERVLSSISDFAYTFDLDGRFTFANRPLLDLWGLRLERARGKNFFDLGYPPDLAATLQRQIRQVIDTGMPVIDDTPYTSPAGAVGWYQYIFSPAIDPDGRVCAVAGSTRDITALRHGEEALRLSLIEQARLLASERDARAEAERANRAKDRFLAVLSHELRTPLSPVVMTVAALEQDGNLSTAVRADMAMIRRNVELEVKLIDDLLDISRITTGKLRLQLDRLDTNELARHVCDMCRSNLRERDVRLHVDLAEDASDVVGDSARLHQVLWNLLNNAAKFTPAGGEIHVATGNAAAGLVRVTVRDTGIGIPDDVLPRIFDAFEQGDPRVTREYGGMGLGLAISKLLIEEHGGSIRANTGGPGLGSTFTVELPALSAEQEARLPEKPLPGPAGAIAPLRVLLVEDHADTAKVLARLLIKSGHTVRTAGTAAAALALAGQYPFDLVISDLGLPDMPGHDLMRELRAGHRMPAIAMSGFGMEADVRNSELAGFGEHLVKPVTFAQLERAIRRVVRPGTAAP
jgi:PAS domain S-box-containing protein